MNQRFARAFLESFLAREGPRHSTDELLEWVQRRNREVTVRVEPVPFSELAEWRFHPDTGNLHHRSGRFFSIEGLRVRADDGHPRQWDQPIIVQPEIGYLGFVSTFIDGVLCVLIQAKIEPGNLNHVQLSPTLQATRSNYMRVHQGRSPRYLELFQEARPQDILLDQLQSEQGARFYRKRNRNILICVPNEIPEDDDFRWVTLGQIKALLAHDNVVNMDTRTVLSGIPLASALSSCSENERDKWVEQRGLKEWSRLVIRSELSKEGIHTLDELISWLTHLKATWDLQAERIPLREVRDWQITPVEIVRPDRRFFRIIGVHVMIDNREVRTWGQPILEPMQEGLVAFLVKPIRGLLHFLVQAKMECGNLDVVELAPTVQCLTGNFRAPNVVPPPFLDEVVNASSERVILDTRQSEEGGRFFREQNWNRIVLADDNFPIEGLPPGYAWMTLGQLREFLRFNNYLNIQARSLLAALPFGPL